MLQIYVIFSLKTTVRVQYFNFSGHVIKTCPFLSGTGHHLPFGGIQLLMIGDLQQLATVVKDEDREIINKYYNSSFFFGSRALRSTDYVTIELKHIYRQKDQAFINLLNKVRDNHVDSDVLI